MYGKPANNLKKRLPLIHDNNTKRRSGELAQIMPVPRPTFPSSGLSAPGHDSLFDNDAATAEVDSSFTIGPTFREQQPQ